MSLPQTPRWWDAKVWTIVVFAAALVGVLVSVRQQLPDQVRVGDKVCYIKLYVFSPPLHIGQGAPPLPSRWRRWLDSADKLTRILERKPEDYDEISLSTPPSDDELSRFKAGFEGKDPLYVATYQQSVAYFFTIRMEGSAERYLYVGSVRGFVDNVLKAEERVSVTRFVLSDNSWKVTHSKLSPELKVIEDLLPVELLAGLDKLVRRR